MTKSTKTVVWVLAGLTFFGCLGTGALVWVLTSAVSSFGATGEWSPDAVPERDLPTLFGVRLPSRPLHYDSRQLGFQDSYYEVLVQLPPGGAPAFLSSNHLARGAEQEIAEPDVVDRMRVLEPTTPSLTGTKLELPASVTPDGGVWLHRNAVLLEGTGGVTWVHLTAFDT